MGSEIEIYKVIALAMGHLGNVCSTLGRLALVVGCSAILSHCASPKSTTVNLEQALIGDWEAVSTQLIIHTEGQTQKSRTINVSEGEWESRMNRTPPQMRYMANHQYTSRYVSLIDNEGRQVHDTVAQSGTWSLQGDTLSIQEPNLSVPSSQFKLKLDQDRLELSSKMDIDGDGMADDEYWMLQRRRK